MSNEVRPQPLTGYFLPATGEYVTIKNGSVKEQYTSRGPEAEVTYVVASFARTELLSYIFGAWTLADSCTVDFPTTIPGQEECGTTSFQACCWEPLYNVQPYPYFMFSSKSQPYLWPDSYSMRPVSGADTPFTYVFVNDTTVNIGNGKDAGFMYTEPLDYYCPGVAAAGGTVKRQDSAQVEITVKYRWKLGNTGVSNMFTGLFATGDLAAPACAANEDTVYIPSNTFLSARRRSEAEVQQVSGKFMKFVNSKQLDPFGGDDIDMYHWDDERVGLLVDVDGKPVTPSANDLELMAGLLINNDMIELEWTNVPQVPVWNFETLKGRVNDAPIWGWPEQGLLFVGYEESARGNFMGQTIYDIRIVLQAKTAAIESIREWSNQAKSEVYKGKIGLWNRRWSRYPETGTNCAGDSQRNHWIHIESIGGKPPYELADFSTILEYNHPCCNEGP